MLTNSFIYLFLFLGTNTASSSSTTISDKNKNESNHQSRRQIHSSQGSYRNAHHTHVSFAHLKNDESSSAEGSSATTPTPSSILLSMQPTMAPATTEITKANVHHTFNTTDFDLEEFGDASLSDIGINASTKKSSGSANSIITTDASGGSGAGRNISGHDDKNTHILPIQDQKFKLVTSKSASAQAPILAPLTVSPPILPSKNLQPLLPPPHPSHSNVETDTGEYLPEKGGKTFNHENKANNNSGISGFDTNLTSQDVVVKGGKVGSGRSNVVGKKSGDEVTSPVTIENNDIITENDKNNNDLIIANKKNKENINDEIDISSEKNNNDGNGNLVDENNAQEDGNGDGNSNNINSLPPFSTSDYVLFANTLSRDQIKGLPFSVRRKLKAIIAGTATEYEITSISKNLDPLLYFAGWAPLREEVNTSDAVYMEESQQNINMESEFGDEVNSELNEELGEKYFGQIEQPNDSNLMNTTSIPINIVATTDKTRSESQNDSYRNNNNNNNRNENEDILTGGERKSMVSSRIDPGNSNISQPVSRPLSIDTTTNIAGSNQISGEYRSPGVAMLASIGSNSNSGIGPSVSTIPGEPPQTSTIPFVTKSMRVMSSPLGTSPNSGLTSPINFQQQQQQLIESFSSPSSYSLQRQPSQQQLNMPKQRGGSASRSTRPSRSNTVSSLQSYTSLAALSGSFTNNKNGSNNTFWRPQSEGGTALGNNTGTTPSSSAFASGYGSGHGYRTNTSSSSISRNSSFRFMPSPSELQALSNSLTGSSSGGGLFRTYSNVSNIDSTPMPMGSAGGYNNGVAGNIIPPFSSSSSSSPAMQFLSKFGGISATSSPMVSRRGSLASGGVMVGRPGSYGGRTGSSCSAMGMGFFGDELGVQVGDYIIGKQIAHGGFSKVKEARTITEDGQEVVRAVKIMEHKAHTLDQKHLSALISSSGTTSNSTSAGVTSSTSSVTGGGLTSVENGRPYSSSSTSVSSPGPNSRTSSGYSSSASLQSLSTAEIQKQRIQELLAEQSEYQQVQIDHEVLLWKSLDHPNILKLLSVTETEDHTYCFADRITGGTLYDLVKENYCVGLSAPLIVGYAQQLAEALLYLHETMHIVHRDVKLENCLIEEETDEKTEGGDDGKRIEKSNIGGPNSQQRYESGVGIVKGNGLHNGSNGQNDGKSIPKFLGPKKLLLCDFGMSDYFGDDEDGYLDDEESEEEIEDDEEEDDEDKNKIDYGIEKKDRTGKGDREIINSKDKSEDKDRDKAKYKEGNLEKAGKLITDENESDMMKRGIKRRNNKGRLEVEDNNTGGIGNGDGLSKRSKELVKAHGVREEEKEEELNDNHKEEKERNQGDDGCYLVEKADESLGPEEINDKKLKMSNKSENFTKISKTGKTHLKVSKDQAAADPAASSGKITTTTPEKLGNRTRVHMKVVGPADTSSIMDHYHYGKQQQQQQRKEDNNTDKDKDKGKNYGCRYGEDKSIHQSQAETSNEPSSESKPKSKSQSKGVTVPQRQRQRAELSIGGVGMGSEESDTENDNDETTDESVKVKSVTTNTNNRNLTKGSKSSSSTSTGTIIKENVNNDGATTNMNEESISVDSKPSSQSQQTPPRRTHSSRKLRSRSRSRRGSMNNGGNIESAGSNNSNSNSNDSNNTSSTVTGGEGGSIGAGPTTEHFGSFPYASPELLESKVPIYDPSVDIWAYGVVLYALIMGELPWRHGLLPVLREKIVKGDWNERGVFKKVYEKFKDTKKKKKISSGNEEDKEKDDNDNDNDDDKQNKLENIEELAKERAFKIIHLLKGCLDKNVENRFTIRQIIDGKYFE